MIERVKVAELRSHNFENWIWLRTDICRKRDEEVRAVLSRRLSLQASGTLIRLRCTAEVNQRMSLDGY